MKKPTCPGPFDLEGECPLPPRKERRLMIWTPEELRRRECADVSNRIERYEAGLPILTNEVPRRSYLESLAPGERKALLTTFEAIFWQGKLNKGPGIMGLAIGSTTFPDSYWRGLQTYLTKEDPAKKGYAERKGEDIDIQLWFEEGAISGKETIFNLSCLRRGLIVAGIPFERRVGRENGTGYLTVPQEHRKKEGVLRYKEQQYEGINFTIRIPKSRSIHLALINGKWSGNDKLRYERITGAPFSLLFRRSRWGDLEKEAQHIKQQPDFFRE